MGSSTHIGGSCAAPECGNLVLFSDSKYCTEHVHLEPQKPTPNHGPSLTSPPRASRLSGRGFVARRARGRLMFTPNPRIQNLDPPSREASSTGTSARITHSPVEKADGRRDVGQPPAQKDPISVAETAPSRLQWRNVQNAADVERTRKSPQTKQAKHTTRAEKCATSSQVKSTSTLRMPKQPSINLQTATEETVDEPGETVLAKHKQPPVANMRPETGISPAGNSKMTEQTNEMTTRNMPSTNLTLRSSDDSKGVPIPRRINMPKLSPRPLQPKVPSDTSVKSKLLDSEDSVIPKSSRLLKPQPPDLLNQSEHAIKPPSSIHHPMTNAKSPAYGMSSGTPDKSQLSKDIPSELNVTDDDEVNMADVSDISDEEFVSPTEPISSFRAKVEARRKRVLANFDSDAFDSFIYRQSKLRPPITVLISSHAYQRGLAVYAGERVFLPVNPAIHGMHNRSRVWYKKKCEEIRKRPGRKAWFGKVMARKRWLQSVEMKLEKERQQAQLTGTAPPYKPPEPRSVKRILDFGDVPEEELPAYVQENPAWLKACAWHRECEEKAALRQRRVDRSKKEAELFFKENFSRR
ncbi:Ff.00g071490.m01.CDS01 [Fusarium sp. VM40]|nr:Ff.00g071490.m01.CDS01 [Fusarium sp. VM40]